MTIPIAIMAVTLLASGGVWCCVFTRRIPQPAAETSPNRPLHINHIALGLVLFLVSLKLISDLSTIGSSPPTEPVTLDRLQSQVLESLFFLALGFGSFLVNPGVTFDRYGIHGRDWTKQILVGVLGFLASWLPVFLFLLATNPLRSEETLHPLLLLIKSDQSGQTLAWITLIVVFIAPLWEELAYRVILQSSLNQWMPISLALPITAIVFSVVHGWPDMVPLFPLALVLGAVYHFYHSYLAAVVTHACFNAAMLAMTLATLHAE